MRESREGTGSLFWLSSEKLNFLAAYILAKLINFWSHPLAA
jgi:hypothetical protein